MKELMKILIVEDDHLQADWIGLNLRQEFAANARIETISSESEFDQWLSSLTTDPPDVVLMDVMVRMCDPTPELANSLGQPSSGEYDYFRAGLRCAAKLRKDQRTSQVPVILYTMLERHDLMEEIESASVKLLYMRKEADLRPLMERIRDLIPAS
jgi:DNA-binding response OmpR family regulator